MGELYSWFLNSARLQVKMLDSIVHASIRWASYPVQLLYNMAIAAYSSYATGRYLQENPLVTISNIQGRFQGQLPKLNQPLNNFELVNLFGGLIDPPYEARGISIGGNDLTGTYHTIGVPVKLSSNFDNIQSLIDKVIAALTSLEQRGHDRFQLQFVIGNPILIPIG